MSLPYPTKVVLPFDIATAQDMNERHANDVALAAGTGLDDGVVTTNKIANQAVTADKIDFTTFSASEARSPSVFTTSADSYVNVPGTEVVYTVPDGVSVLKVTGTMNVFNNTPFLNVLGALARGTTNIDTQSNRNPYTTGSNQSRLSFYFQRLESVTPGNTYTFRLRISSSAVSGSMDVQSGASVIVQPAG